MAAMADFRGKELFQFFYAADNLAGESWDIRSLANDANLSEKDKIAGGKNPIDLISTDRYNTVSFGCLYGRRFHIKGRDHAGRIFFPQRPSDGTAYQTKPDKAIMHVFKINCHSILIHVLSPSCLYFNYFIPVH